MFVRTCTLNIRQMIEYIVVALLDNVDLFDYGKFLAHRARRYDSVGLIFGHLRTHGV